MLTQNMRLVTNMDNDIDRPSMTSFAEWLLQIGDGLVGQPNIEDPHDTSWIQIPSSLLIPPGSNSLENLRHFVYETAMLNNPTATDLSVQAIVCPTNEMADMINSIVLKKMGQMILGQRTNQAYIESIMNVSNYYTISEYSCPELDRHQKVIENTFYIDVGLSSIISPLPDTVTIPTTWFRFVSKPQLIGLGENPPYFSSFSGPMRPQSAPSGIPTTQKDIKLKMQSELLEKTFMVKASITEFVFQDSWCQITCPTCRDPIFKRGPHWFCSAHGAIEKPSLTNTFSVMITDTTDTLQAIVSDTSSRKLLSANPETSLPEINSINRKVLPTAVTKQKGEIKNMSIQMLRTSTSENLRFIIIDLVKRCLLRGLFNLDPGLTRCI
ncbi:unnamed protein product [Lactuca saligna]|uniref:ATP-dependent DNA helicase n=1 Tax=Lactuca saligna TaxID=75948 RepID=A0AA35YDU6_LACSI|nr:unnamed protein product [Lactuca saligna]